MNVAPIAVNVPKAAARQNPRTYGCFALVSGCHCVLDTFYPSSKSHRHDVSFAPGSHLGVGQSVESMCVG